MQQAGGSDLGGSRGLPPRPVLTFAMLESEEENAAIFEPFARRSLGLEVRLPRILQPPVSSRSIVPKE